MSTKTKKRKSAAFPSLSVRREDALNAIVREFRVLGYRPAAVSAVIRGWGMSTAEQRRDAVLEIFHSAAPESEERPGAVSSPA